MTQSFQVIKSCCHYADDVLHTNRKTLLLNHLKPQGLTLDHLKPQGGNKWDFSPFYI